MFREDMPKSLQLICQPLHLLPKGKVRKLGIANIREAGGVNAVEYLRRR